MLCGLAWVARVRGRRIDIDASRSTTRMRRPSDVVAHTQRPRACPNRALRPHCEAESQTLVSADGTALNKLTETVETAAGI